ncbi:MAG: zinc ribbon domain-containing protein [Deltaproteobacteria bacterium]|nr:MAG: zinc ribbon domain-containing protein [Deltaproteobacteria bacterium]
MPIFEFVCRDCGREFEELFLPSDKNAPECPHCGSANAEKLMSAGNFRPHGIPSGSGGFKPPPCSPSRGCTVGAGK